LVFHISFFYFFSLFSVCQMDHNLKTAFLGCKYVLPAMVRQGGGAVVNISSVAGISHQVGGRTNVAYAASKAGIIAFSRSTPSPMSPRASA